MTMTDWSCVYALVGVVIGWAIAEFLIIPSRWFQRWRDR